MHDDSVEQQSVRDSNGAVLGDRMDMSWMPRAQIEKQCCGVRDIRETVTTGGMRELARIREWRVSDPALAQDRSSGGMIRQGRRQGLI